MKCSKCGKDCLCTLNNTFPECRDRRHKYCYCLECHVYLLENGKSLISYQKKLKIHEADESTIADLRLCFGERIDAIVLASKL
jgi:hypothetical protein